MRWDAVLSWSIKQNPTGARSKILICQTNVKLNLSRGPCNEGLTQQHRDVADSELSMLEQPMGRAALHSWEPARVTTPCPTVKLAARRCRARGSCSVWRSAALEGLNCLSKPPLCVAATVTDACWSSNGATPDTNRPSTARRDVTITNERPKRETALASRKSIFAHVVHPRPVGWHSHHGAYELRSQDPLSQRSQLHLGELLE